MLKYLILFPLLGFATLANAQMRKIAGTVTNQNQRLSGVFISNANTNSRTISSDRGEFAIMAQKGDTLITYQLNYLNDTLIVGDQSFLNVKLKQSAINLKEVRITGGAVRSAAETYQKNRLEYKDIYRKGDKSHAIAVTPIGIGLNIAKIYSAFSKEGNDARRMQRILDASYKNGVIDERFSKKLVASVTGYKDNQLAIFMEKYQPSYETALVITDYELLQYIKQKFQEDQRNY